MKELEKMLKTMKTTTTTTHENEVASTMPVVVERNDEFVAPVVSQPTAAATDTNDTKPSNA